MGDSFSPVLTFISERGCVLASSKRGDGAEDCARPGSCGKNVIGGMCSPAALCVGEEDATVDPVESHSLA